MACRVPPESRELVLEVELPGQAVVPAVTQYRSKASPPPSVVPQPRKETDTKAMYRDLVARLALRAIDEALAATLPELVDVKSAIARRPFVWSLHIRVIGRLYLVREPEAA